MADQKADTRKSPESADTVKVGYAAEASSQAVFTTPVVLKREKKGKGKKKYTKGTKGLQRIAYGVSKAAFRTTKSLSKGLDTFAKDSNKSSKKRRDGLVRDVFKNASSGFADAATELGKAPGEIARRVGTRRVWKVVRGFVPPLGR